MAFEKLVKIFSVGNRESFMLSAGEALVPAYISDTCNTKPISTMSLSNSWEKEKKNKKKRVAGILFLKQAPTGPDWSFSASFIGGLFQPFWLIQHIAKESGKKTSTTGGCDTED